MGGSGIDTIDTSSDDANVVVDLDRETLSFETEIDRIVGFENVTTGGGDDVVVGNADDNVIATGVGNDTVTDGAGSDTVDLGSGNDRMIVCADESSDIFAGGDGFDTLDLSEFSLSIVVDLDGGELKLRDAAEGAVSDVISAFEAVIAGSGDDIIIANDDVNVMFGGAGNDTFVFLSSRGAGNGRGHRDRIGDFEVGDSIDIDALMQEFEIRDDVDPRFAVFTLLTGADREFTRPGELRISHAYTEFEGNPGTLVLEGNLDFDDAAEFQIELDGDYNAIQLFMQHTYGHHTV
jgi:Ca2+-binding RTX toxin-like protein